MQNYDDFMPEEGAEQNQHLIQKLHRFYQANDADAQSHARMRERLLFGSVQNEDTLKLASERERPDSMLYNHNSSARGSKSHGELVTWQRRLSLIAAVLFVALLVGSLVVVLSHARQSATGNRSKSAASTTWSGRQAQLIGIHMFTATTGWAEGTDGTVLRTTDGGIHWKDVTPQQMPHTTLWSGRNQFLNAASAWIAVTINKDNSLYYRPSTTSLVFHTTDGGQTWQEVTLNTQGFQVGEITFANLQDGWLLTKLEQGIHVVTGPETTSPPDLFRTTNGGKTWVQVLSSSSSQAQIFSNVVITGFSFGNQTTGLLTGMIGNTPQLYRTHDGGLTWQLQILSTPRSSSIPIPSGIGIPYFFTSTDAVLSLTYNQDSDFTTYTSHDGGATWSNTSFLHLASDPAKHIYGFAEPPLFINMQYGWVEGFDGQHGILYATVDGGQHWTKVTPMPGTITVNVLPNFTTPTIGWEFDYAFDTHTGNQNTVLYETTDGGHIWKQVHAIFPGFIVPKSAFSH
jgi:photosystem II stability/assembly factor-like uncharacterized protein